MIPKNAQVSSVILLGAILLALFILVSVYQTTENGFESSASPVDEKPVLTLVNACLDEMAREAAVVVAGRGGYYTLPEPVVVFSDEEAGRAHPVPYYYDYAAYGTTGGGHTRIPSSETIAESISAYLAENLESCVAPAVKKLPAYNLTFLFEKQELVSSFSGRALLVALTLPTSIVSLETQKTTMVSAYSTVVPTRLFEAWEVAQQIIIPSDQDRGQNGSGGADAWCLSCAQQAVPQTMQLAFTESSQPPNHLIVFELHYNETGAERGAADGGSIFRFAARLAASPVEEKFFIVGTDTLAALSATAGKPFLYRVATTSVPSLMVTQPLFQFSDDSPLFDVVADGEDRGIIRFTPTIDMRGVHLFEIKIHQPFGAWDSALGKITIE